jgi:aminoglycoside phosphotransferase (APT) family kinase protein
MDVPQVRAVGRPDLGYPYPWSVVDWLDGDDALAAPPVSQTDAAADLAGFVHDLRRLPAGGSPALPRTRPLAGPDTFVREMIADFRQDEGDPVLLARVWDDALALAEWEGPPVLVHADLHPLNLLTRRGRIVGVVDWGTLSLGDPARDLLCAWTVLSSEGREAFRDRLRPDPASWARGRAHAFSMAVMAIPYYRTSNARFREAMVRTLAEVLPEMDRG